MPYTPCCSQVLAISLYTRLSPTTRVIWATNHRRSSSPRPGLRPPKARTTVASRSPWSAGLCSKSHHTDCTQSSRFNPCKGCATTSRRPLSNRSPCSPDNSSRTSRISSRSASLEVRRTLPGTPATSELGGITVCSGSTAPAAMIDPSPIRQSFRMVHPIPISTASSTTQPWTVALLPDGYPIAHNHRVHVAHSMQYGAVLHIRVGADADRVDVAAHHRVHPHAGMLAQRHIADNLRRNIKHSRTLGQ